MTNAERFIDAYNNLDKSLRKLYGIKPTFSFTEVVRRVSHDNELVRRFSDELIDYARLRNAIVHSSEPNEAIAEPHDDVVEDFERIAKIIATPPKASKVASFAKTVKANASLKTAINIMTENKYSNLPVVDNGSLVGVITAKNVVTYIGAHLNAVDYGLEGATVSDALIHDSVHYAVVGDCTVDKVLDLFNSNAKLKLIIMTSDGKPTSNLLGVITAADIVEINRLLERY